MAFIVYYPCVASQLEHLLCSQEVLSPLVLGMFPSSSHTRSFADLSQKNHVTLVDTMHGYFRVTEYLADCARKKEPWLTHVCNESAADVFADKLAQDDLDDLFHLGHEYHRILNSVFISCYSFEEARKREPENPLLAFALDDSFVRIRGTDSYLVPYRLSFGSLLGILVPTEDVRSIKSRIAVYEVPTLVLPYEDKQNLFK